MAVYVCQSKRLSSSLIISPTPRSKVKNPLLLLSFVGKLSTPPSYSSLATVTFPGHWQFRPMSVNRRHDIPSLLDELPIQFLLFEIRIADALHSDRLETASIAG